MKVLKRAAPGTGIGKHSLNPNRRKLQQGHSRVIGGNRVPSAMNKKIWHNWLMGENYP